MGMPVQNLVDVLVFTQIPTPKHLLLLTTCLHTLFSIVIHQIKVAYMEAGGDGEPVTPAGRFFLNPSMQQVVNCIIGLKNPIDVPTIKLDVQNLIQSHPRFTSVVVKNEKGREEWRKVDKVNLDDHFVIVQDDGGGDGGDDNFVNKYVADVTVSTPLDPNRPLWEIHILPLSKCLVIRLHHALGDGISMMSLFLSIFKRADNPSLPLTIPGTNKTQRDPKKNKPYISFSFVFSFLTSLWKLVLVVCCTTIFTFDMMVRMLWLKDEETPISGGDGVELWPRVMSTATFELSDMKIVKGAIDGTINDVLVGIISLGLQRYLQTRTTTSLKSRKTLRITGLAMVNTRKIPGAQDLKRMMEDKSKIRWGNNFGFILLPIYLRKHNKNNNNVCDDPLEHVRRAKQMLDKKKLSLEAHLSYRSGSLIMSLLGPEVATKLNKKLICNTTFTLSNVVGPAEEALFAGNPIAYLRTTSTALPHALTMHMVSYKGKADMQILAAKNMIPDPDVLAKSFQDALADMKTAALHANYSHQICKKDC